MLPAGIYRLYVTVTPAGDATFQDYDFWEMYFEAKMVSNVFLPQQAVERLPRPPLARLGEPDRRERVYALQRLTQEIYTRHSCSRSGR
jgi:hypothetical protein